jgi:hypothetical protein
MLLLLTPCVFSAKLDTPQPDAFIADGNAAFCQKIFYISMAEIESIVEPDGIGNDIWRESVTFVCVHHRIIPFPAFNLSVPPFS